MFLDAGGSAPLLPQSIAALDQAREQGWADPSRLHSEGRSARGLLEASRQAVAQALGTRTEEVQFAPSYPLAVHTALRSVHRGRRRVGNKVVVSAVERASVLNAARFAAGDDVRMVPVDPLGRIDAERFRSELGAPGVALACLQHANGEVGSRQPVDSVHEAARAAGVPLFVDAGASVGHVDVGSSWDVLTAHPADWGGPDGVAILAVRSGVRTARIHPEDGDHWFPGGVSVAAAFAAAVSLQTAIADQQASARSRSGLIDQLRSRIPQLIDDVDIVGSADSRLPHVLTFSCLFVEGEALVTELDRLGFAVGSGSACTSLTLEPSHVLAAMGALTHGNIRLALHPGISQDDIDRFLSVVPDAVRRVRAAMGAGAL